jgi:hypothetical protein
VHLGQQALSGRNRAGSVKVFLPCPAEFGMKFIMKWSVRHRRFQILAKIGYNPILGRMNIKLGTHWFLPKKTAKPKGLAVG